jgi:hypothetical protein
MKHKTVPEYDETKPTFETNIEARTLPYSSPCG